MSRRAPNALVREDMSSILVTRRGRVAILTFNRPEQGNRLTTALAAELAAVLRSARDDGTIGACALTGAGDVFCLGGDYHGAGPTHEGRAAYADALLAMDEAMARLGKPLVAAVNGDAHAGGFAVLAACDLAVAASDATFGLPEAAKGLFPFIALATVRDALPKKVLFEVIYGARLINAAEASSLHVINQAVERSDVLPRAVALAEEASAHNPAIVALGRDLYYEMRAARPSEAMNAARQALLAALDAADRSQR
jgi:enoyl-CoA hydratase/carnithine racemase